MEDVITEAAPPSRFLEEDLNIFTPPSPALPTPFLIFPHDHPQQPLKPSLLIVALSPPSLALFRSLPAVASLILPELPLSLPDHAADILSLSPSALLAAVPFPVPAPRARAVARLLLGDRILPDAVLVLDSLDPRNYRGKLSADETVAFKLESSAERKRSEGQKMLGELEYYPSGSVVDGLGAAILARCQVMNVRASLCVSWPEFDASVVALIKGVLQRGVLRGFEFGSSGEAFKFGRRRKDRVLHSELYI